MKTIARIFSRLLLCSIVAVGMYGCDKDSPAPTGGDGNGNASNEDPIVNTLLGIAERNATISEISESKDGSYILTLSDGDMLKVPLSATGVTEVIIKDDCVAFFRSDNSSIRIMRTAAAADNPTDPSKPSNPTDNDTPGNPTNPDTPSNPQNPGTSGGTVTKGDVKTLTVNGVSFDMIAVKGGTFTMGGTSEQGYDAYDRERPTRRVTLSNYYIGKTEVTQALWMAVMGSNPSNWQGDNLPVGKVSWDDCQEFIKKLNQLTGKTFALPTEAQWEYAARGGNQSKGYKYSGSNSVGDVAWYYDNTNSTHAVGTKAPNELGIYDMSGNVWEWCSDWYGDYSSSAQTDPTGPSSGSSRVIRGGSWCNSASGCRVSYRSYYGPSSRDNDVGFRVVLLR